MMTFTENPPKSDKTPLSYGLLKTFKFPAKGNKCMEFAIYSQSLGVFKLKHGKRDRKETK